MARVEHMCTHLQKPALPDLNDILGAVSQYMKESDKPHYITTLLSVMEQGVVTKTTVDKIDCLQKLTSENAWGEENTKLLIGYLYSVDGKYYESKKILSETLYGWGGIKFWVNAYNCFNLGRYFDSSSLYYNANKYLSKNVLVEYGLYCDLCTDDLETIGSALQEISENNNGSGAWEIIEEGRLILGEILEYYYSYE